MNDTGLWSVIGFMALMVVAALLIAEGYKRSNARLARLEEEREKRA